MANKFQKSVMERIEQETARRSKLSQGEGNAEAQQNIPPVLPNQVIPLKEKIIDGMTEQPMSVPSTLDDYLRREPQRLAKNKTFYLDMDLIEAIRLAARREGVTDSKLANDILRHVLGL
jgi:hypothetical protein